MVHITVMCRQQVAKKDDAVVNLRSVNIEVYALSVNIGYTYNKVFELHVILH